MHFTDTKWDSHESDYYLRGSYDKQDGGDLFHYCTIAEIRYDAPNQLYYAISHFPKWTVVGYEERAGNALIKAVEGYLKAEGVIG